MDDQAEPVSPLGAALAGKCPRCGRGALYQGVLKLSDRCTECDLDIGALDQGDGPAAFAIFFVGAIVMPLAIWLEFAMTPPVWLHLVLWVPLTFGLSIISLRLLKSWLVADQFKHKAHEGQLDL